MPYIRQKDRLIAKQDPVTSGELNFAISNLLSNYIKIQGLSYTAINDIIGALEGAKLEFYRRVAVPYEDEKIKENGDVY